MFGSRISESLREVFQGEADPLDVSQKESLCASLYHELISEIIESQPEACRKLSDERLQIVAGTYMNGYHFPRSMVVGIFNEEFDGGLVEGGIILVARSKISEWESKSLVVCRVNEKKKAKWLVFRRGEDDQSIKQVRGKRRLQKDFRRSYDNLSGITLSDGIKSEDLMSHLEQVDRDIEQVKNTFSGLMHVE